MLSVADVLNFREDWRAKTARGAIKLAIQISVPFGALLPFKLSEERSKQEHNTLVFLSWIHSLDLCDRLLVCLLATET